MLAPEDMLEWHQELVVQAEKSGWCGTVDELASDLARFLDDHVQGMGNEVRRRDSICTYWHATPSWVSQWHDRFKLEGHTLYDWLHYGAHLPEEVEVPAEPSSTPAHRRAS